MNLKETIKLLGTEYYDKHICKPWKGATNSYMFPQFGRLWKLPANSLYVHRVCMLVCWPDAYKKKADVVALVTKTGQEITEFILSNNPKLAELNKKYPGRELDIVWGAVARLHEKDIEYYLSVHYMQRSPSLQQRANALTSRFQKDMYIDRDGNEAGPYFVWSEYTVKRGERMVAKGQGIKIPKTAELCV